ncbi:histidine kinase [Maribacter confluentis]|uniref:Histidine kinase n=1 Tax=Maribacter confluentis TaxID=1656093 RepID=A0ABT8RS72_9FLAO|nr:histidine kinase [Maribacter confluentis]MDO1513729.1 histidine kinase [Maribacter confluentis]
MTLLNTINPKYRNIGWHIVGWAILFLLPIIFTRQTEEVQEITIHDIQFSYLNLITKVFWILLFYVNTEILIPKLLYAKRILLFICAQIVLFFVVIGIRGIFFHLIVTDIEYIFYNSFVVNSPPLFFTVFASIAFKTLQDRLKSERTAQELKNENLETELSFLRSQISPHFLFNVLNTVVSQIRFKSKELEPTVLKLSSLLQYMLYETNDAKVPLKSEVNYLEDYIDLQRTRFGKRVKITFIANLDQEWYLIEPMLLIPFVENAFKHGTGNIKEPVIEISLKTNESELFFEVRNKFLENDISKDTVSGIGLSNVRRRLELLYGERYQLEFNKTSPLYEAKLKLILE